MLTQDRKLHRPSRTDDQRVARHILGLRDVQQVQHRRRYVDRAPFVEPAFLALFIDQNDRDAINRMGRMRQAGVIVNQLFDIAVIRGNNDSTPLA